MTASYEPGWLSRAILQGEIEMLTWPEGYRKAMISGGGITKASEAGLRGAIEELTYRRTLLEGELARRAALPKEMSDEAG